ncbi:hypothetical protein IMG5_169530, partial [Ichthyophthirius multifiliis]
LDIKDNMDMNFQNLKSEKMEDLDMQIIQITEVINQQEKKFLLMILQQNKSKKQLMKVKYQKKMIKIGLVQIRLEDKNQKLSQEKSIQAFQQFKQQFIFILIILQQTSKIGSLIDIKETKDADGLSVFFYLVQVNSILLYLILLFFYQKRIQNNWFFRLQVYILEKKKMQQSFGKGNIQNIQHLAKAAQKVPAKLTPSELVQKLLSGNILEDFYKKPQIKKFLNLADYSIYTNTDIPIDEPLFEPIPHLIQFTDYEPLQLKEKIFRLRNKDKVARRVKILQPDSRLFQVIPVTQNTSSQYSKNKAQQQYDQQTYVGNKIAPGMEACFVIKFSPEAKIDYQYELVVVTEREQFIVPIYAIGKRAMIDFPDELDFGNCPVKYITEKPIIIRNLGEKTTKWFLNLPQDFQADKKEGVLEYGKNEQIVMKFFPKETKPYKSEAVLKYDNLQAFIPIYGVAQNHLVYLSKNLVEMDESYIGLLSQATVQIINKSEVKVDFEWRAFVTEKEEQEKKNRLKEQLQQEEAEEKMLLKEIVNNEVNNGDYEVENNINSEEEDDEEDRDEKAIIQKRQKKAELTLARKYRDIRKAIEDDLLLFQDDIFSIEPIQGQIWANSEMTITLTFKPKGSHTYKCPAYCNISCIQDRLSLQLQGVGIGPQASLNQNEINLGDPFVNEVINVVIMIENEGEIECKYELLPNERHFGKMFKFMPEMSTLKVGEKQEIRVQFKSSKPGEFKETFRWRLEGSVNFLSALFIGHIRAPQFEFDREVIDFGKVSFNFPQEQTLKLINKSTVPFDYNLRIPGDGKMKEKEFHIEKANRTIAPGETIDINIVFTPRYTKKYEMVLTIDIEGVAQDMKCLTIKAESEVPQVELKPKDRLDFGEIFLKHRDIQVVQLINNSNLQAKFEVQEQKVESKILASYEVEPSSGIIKPGEVFTIQVKLVTNRLGDITLPLAIVIIGSNNNLPQIINIIAQSVGPKVLVGEQLREIDFGNVQVLQEYSQKITITNRSKIEADYRAFTKNKVSIFKPIQKYGILKPEESMDVEIICCADDSIKFQDMLHFVIKDGMDIDVVLKAKGVGSTIFCKDDITNVNFKTLYTHHAEYQEIFVENKGRKPQKLTWQRKIEKKKFFPIDEKSQLLKSKMENTSQNQQQPQEENHLFNIAPESVTLPAKHGIMFQFRAYAVKTGKFQEQFILNSVIGNDRKSHQLYQTTIEGEFIRPTLKFNEKKIYFKYIWEKNVPFMQISKDLEITCISILKTNFMLKTIPPFSINKEKVQLSYGEKEIIRVDFDPGYKVDRVSGEQLGKLTITHQDHPHKDTIDLVGEVCFPNIKLEQTSINFGAILNETSKKMLVNMQNTSEMSLYYDWTFLEDELKYNKQDGILTIPINEVFDILPLSGYLEAGETQQVEFVYNAYAGQKFQTTAVCHVEGGPKYEVVLIGDSSLIVYKLSIQQIDFGDVRFCDWVTKDFLIENNGKVTFEYKILLDNVKRKNFVECSSLQGRILGGEKQKISVRICPAMPSEFKEIIQVQIGYFEPENIVLTAKAFYSAILVNLDKHQTEQYIAKYQEEFEKKKNEREAQLKRAQLIAKAQEKTHSNSFSQIKSIEQIENEIIKELDRQLYCQLIQEALEQQYLNNLISEQPIINKTILDKQPCVESKLYERITLNTFICDFGNVVINSPKSKTIKIVNASSQPIELLFDTKLARLNGFTMPERPPKIPGNSDLQIKVSYIVKNKVQYGKNKCLVPFEVKNGAHYALELISNITIPEITLDNNQEDMVDFGKVICGQRKTIYLRFVNLKEIPCIWSLNTRPDISQNSKKEDQKFIINPSNGIIASGQKQIVQLSFAPSAEKNYQWKFTINIQENPKNFVINMIGSGVQVNLDINNSVCIGPVLPYDQFAYQIVEIKNNTQYETELYSLDFDKMYLNDEEILQNYENFDNQDTVFEQIRQPGGLFWENIKESVEKKKKANQIKQKIEQNENLTEQERENLQKEYEKLTQVEKINEYPEKVEDINLHHIIVLGHTSCGKTQSVKFIAQEYRKYIFDLDECIKFCIQKQTEGGLLAEQYLNEKQLELENINNEREKLKKKAGKKAPELENKWGPVNEAQFLYLPEDIFVQCIKDRMKERDCNAGIIFDGLQTKYSSSQLFTLKVLMNAFGNQKIQMLVFQPQVDDEGLEIWKLIEWPGMQDLIKNEENVQIRDQASSINTKKTNNNNENKKNNNNENINKKQQQQQKKVSKQKVHINQKSNQQQDHQQQLQYKKEEELQEDEQDLFDIFLPKPYNTQEEKEKDLKILNELIKLFQNKYTEKIEHPINLYPVFEEGKKEEKKPIKKDAKGKPIIEEEPEIPQQVPIDYTQTLMKGPREITYIPFHFNIQQLQKTCLELVQPPIYPDVNTLPIPEPIFHQILTKPTRNILKKKTEIEKSSTIKYFQILTPINKMFKQQHIQLQEEEQIQHEETSKLSEEIQIQNQQQQQTQQQQSLNTSTLKREKSFLGYSSQTNNNNITQITQPNIEFKPQDLTDKPTRWIIPANQTLLLVIRFFTKSVGTYEGKLEFENFYSNKRYVINIKGIADFPTISQLSKNIYWQIKKNRPPNPPESYLQKYYIQNENIFDFGPLLIGKNPEKRNEIRNINSCTFRISNQGKFDTQLQFQLMSSIKDQNDPEYKKGIFWIEPEILFIAKNDVPQEIRVWAIPEQPIKYKEDIIIMIQDNPLPVILPLQCTGSKPYVTIEEGDPIKFERLLLNQQAKKQIRIKNNGQIPCIWKITGINQLPEEFSFTNTEGELKPCQESIIYVNFKAIKQEKFSHQINLEVQDCEGLDIKQETKSILVEAEAFDISVELKFPENNQENMLDFGAVRVSDVKDCLFSVKNIGLYQVQFCFVMKKKIFKENFKIEPMKVSLQPGQEKQIMVRFMSQNEIKLNTNNSTTDIIMEILEGKTLELYKPVPINVKVNAVFSKYTILPLKNINFGPIQFNDSKTLSFEIKNEGLFEYNYTIFNYYDEDFRKQLLDEQNKEKEARLQAALASTGTENKDPKKNAKKEAPKQDKKGKGGKNQGIEGQLKIGQWTINNSKGTIPSDSSAIIEVQFTGNSQRLYVQKIAIDITCRDPEDQPKGILYELIGESCIPGINCENFETIFEEQIIVASQNQNQNITSMINSNVFFYEEKTFFFGTLVPSQHPDGICEKFKIINPNKIPCNVKFDVRKRNPNSTEPFAFEIAQKQAKIYPHEHTYVKILFKPTIMAQYNGIFEAIVENGEQNPRTHKLIFDLRGEGAMPTIKLEKPKEWFNDSTPLLKFPKVRIDKSCVLPIVLKNDGKIAATVKWDLVMNENFKFQDQLSYTLTHKTYKSFNIEFKPKQAGVKQWQIAMQTLMNPYEITRFMIQGEGFYEDIVFENLPNEAEEEINFNDQIIGKKTQVGFQIKSNKNVPIKFTWNTQGNEDFSFIPKTGHIPALGSKFINIIYKANKTVTYKNIPLILETKQIKQNSDKFIDWDDSMTNIKYVTQKEYEWWIKKKKEEEELRKQEEEENKLKKPGKKADKKPLKKLQEESDKEDKPPAPLPGEIANIQFEEPIQEPECQIIEKTETNVTLKTSAISDYAKYEVDTREIFFKPTLIYTSRTHTFKVKNTSLINIKYSCKIISHINDIGQIDSGFFYVTPKQGILAPNCDEQFTVKFSPTEVEENNERFVIITIENLDQIIQPLVIQLNGEAERPVCHFELQPNKYREKKQDLDQSYSIIEFESLGTRVKNTKKFYVVNPTSVGYEFEWKKLEEYKLPAGANTLNDTFFRCLTQKGVILSGKKFEMVFEYTPDIVGTHESYWYFEISSQKITQNFLIVGSVIEPNVFFDVGKVNFGPLLLGGKNNETVKIINIENVPMFFSFERDTIKGDPEYADSLQVSPIQGTINANSDINIEICFTPKVETSFNYNLLCNVKRKSRPISLNVKGIGYILHHSVSLQQIPGTILDHTQAHLLNLGDIYVNEKRSKIIQVENSGEFNFDFSIKKSQQHLQYIQIIPENGTVKQNDKFLIEVKFAPLQEIKLNNKTSFMLQISSGPSYQFILQGTARKPGVELSFFSYDFGPQYVLKQPLPITVYLEMRNRDQSAMSVETAFEKTNYLDVILPPGQVILPLQTETLKDKKGIIQVHENNILKIPIILTPRESKKYEETITFDINGLHKIDVKIQGEGIPLKLELENTQDQNIDFGVARVGSDNQKVVRVLNLSKKPINITFDLNDQLKEFQKNFIYLFPSEEEFQIPSKGYKDVEILFHPQTRLHQFKQELFYKIVDNQEQRKLLNINGACHGVEIKLTEENIGFGVVVINSKKQKTLTVSNMGDIGAKFEWDFSYCSKYFTINPIKGFLPPHEDSVFTIIFHPDVVDNDIRFTKVRCDIEGSQPLYINLLGKCIAQPIEQILDIKFTAMVRSQAKQKVTIKNPIAEACRIKVLINANNPSYTGYFYGKEILEIPANGSADYEIIYSPLTMTSNPEIPQIKQSCHESTLFFPLPDGNAILYNLFGYSTPPAPIQTFDIVTKAKSTYMQIIPIKNWLKQTQRFAVEWKMENQDPTILINGANTYDVAGDSVKEYKLSIFCLKQTSSKITIQYKNVTTFEFLTYKINLTVQPPDFAQKIEMSAIVRETISKLITVINPLSFPIDVKKEMFIVENDNVYINPPSFTIPPNSEFGFEIVFRPLLIKEEQSKVTLNSPELGQFVYLLQLKGVAQSQIQRNVTLKASLGSDITQTFKFTNFCKKQTTYICRVDKIGAKVQNPVDPKAKLPPVQVDFSVEQPTILAPPAETLEGNEVSLNIKFEPSMLGETSAILYITSAEGGEYNCMLYGISYAPQPKGPYKIGGAKSAPIEFKNPFFEPFEFSLRIDNPNFSCSVKNPVKIDGKKNLSINIAYKFQQGTSTNGRLIIQMEKSDYPPWVFYLQGE